MPASWTSEPGGPLFCPDLSTIIVFSNSQAEISWSLLISQQYGLGNVEQSSSALKRIWEISMLPIPWALLWYYIPKAGKRSPTTRSSMILFSDNPWLLIHRNQNSYIHKSIHEPEWKSCEYNHSGCADRNSSAVLFFKKIKRLEKIVVKISPE